MNFKNTNSERSTITRNTIDFEEKTGNVYETIVAMAKRSNQISVELKEELTSKLQEFASTTSHVPCLNRKILLVIETGNAACSDDGCDKIAIDCVLDTSLPKAWDTRTGP